MNRRPAGSSRRHPGILAATVLAVLTALAGPAARAHEENAASIESYLHGLVEDGAITEVQHRHIDELYGKGDLPQLESWLTAQETAGQLSHDTHLYLDALLKLSVPEVELAAAPAAYTGNGNVTLLGHLDPQPPNPYYSDNTS